MKYILMFILSISILFSSNKNNFEEKLNKDLKTPFTFSSILTEVDIISYYKYREFGKKVCSEEFKNSILKKNITIDNKYYNEKYNIYKKCIIENVEHQQFIQNEEDKEKRAKYINKIINFLFAWIQ
jgi:hypothetical protein